MIRLNRNEILLKKLKWREGLIPLSYSRHAKTRLSERVDGELIVAPTVLRVTRDNLYNGSIVNTESTRLKEACVRLDYKQDKWMFVALVLGNGAVKSIWVESKFKKNDRKTTELREEVGIVQESVEEKTSQKSSKWEIYLWRVKKFLFSSYFTKS